MYIRTQLHTAVVAGGDGWRRTPNDKYKHAYTYMLNLNKTICAHDYVQRWWREVTNGVAQNPTNTYIHIHTY